MANTLLDFLTLDVLESSCDNAVFGLPLHAAVFQKPGIKHCRVRYLPSHHSTHHALHELFFCENCLSVLSSDPIDIVEEVESYYCPQTLENLPSSEAVAFKYKSARIFSCPECCATLTIVEEVEKEVEVEKENEGSFFFHCSHCNWDSTRCQLKGATSSGLIETAMQHDKALDENSTIKQLIDQYTQLSEQDATFPSAPDAKGSLTVKLQGPWRWEHADAQRTRKQTEAFTLSQPEPLTTLPESSLESCSAEDRTTLAQRLHSCMTQPLERSKLRPQRVPLRTKRSVRCRRCLDQGAPNILIKAQINPLKGDSSVRMNVGSWFKKKSLAFDNLPRIIALWLVDDNALALLITNPLEHPVELTLQADQGEDWYHVIVNEYDELAEIDFQLDKRVQLNREDSDADYVLGRWRNKAILRLPSTWRKDENEHAEGIKIKFVCEMKHEGAEEPLRFSFLIS